MVQIENAQMVLIENAQDARVIADDGTDITERCVLEGVIPKLALSADREVASRIAQVKLKSPRSDLWLSVRVEPRERAWLIEGGELGIDARIRISA